MSDLPDRLREVPVDSEDGAVCHEAAKEIERLREELASEGACAECLEENSRLRQERDRLRSGLRDIANAKVCRNCQFGLNACNCPNGPEWVEASDYNVAVRRIKKLLDE